MKPHLKAMATAIIGLTLLNETPILYADNTTYTIKQGEARQTTLQSELIHFNKSILSHIRQNKYEKMAQSPFSFYRGSAHLYYRDLDHQDLIQNSDFYRPDAVTWIQGDLHVQNYGAFDDDEGNIVYDLNDFDESWITSYLYDVFRAAASLVLVIEENGGSSSNDTATILDAFTESYLDQLEDYRGNSHEKSFKVTKNNAYGRLDEFLDATERDNSREKMLDKWTNKGATTRYFDLTYEKLEPIDSTLAYILTQAINDYKNHLTSNLKGRDDYFTVLDVAKRVDAGTGSLGTPRYYVLIQGESTSKNDDRILDVKQQSLPSVYPYLNSTDTAHLSGFTPGERVATAQKAMLTDADDHLGSAIISTQSYSVRERSPFKESFDTAELTSTTRFIKLAEQWGTILATAHARADNDFDASLVPTSFEEIMHDLTDHFHAQFRADVRSFALSYAHQVNIDYALFVNLLRQNSL